MTNVAPLPPGHDATVTTPTAGRPLVHFYNSDDSLFDVVGKFLGPGLDAGDRLLVIVTPPHRRGIEQQLQSRGVERATASGQLLFLDASETLSRFMVDGRPDADRFHQLIEEMLTRVSAGLPGVQVRAYGEMVDLLWRDGKPPAAMALEELWKEASARHAFSLLCAYSSTNCYDDANEGSFTNVNRAHPHDLASESAPEPHGGAEVHALRERLRSAELETERQREVERALREASFEQRRAAQEALLASEARFHQLVDAITDYAIFMLDPGGHIATWNPGAQRIKGYRQDEIWGQHFSLFYTPEDRAAGKPERILDAVRRTGRYEDESWRVRKDGSRFWANVVITAHRDHKGDIAGFAKVTRDLSARREAEEKARQLAQEQIARAASEKASRQLARLNRVGALFIAEPSRLETVLLEIVDAAIDIAGADFGNIQLLAPEGGDLRIAAHRGFPQWWLDFWNRVSEGQGSCGTALERGERVVVADVDESPIFVGTPALEIQRGAGVRAVVSIPIVNRSGSGLGMFSVHFRSPQRPDDQTLQMLGALARQAAGVIDRARSDEASERARQELERVNRAKDEFLATASHELRSPLNAILGWATMLRHDHGDLAKLERGLEVIERNAKSQARIVGDLLDMSRIIGGKLRLSLKETQVSAVIQAAAEVVRPAAEAKHITLVLELDPAMGTTVGDPDRLQQIVWNLLVNAVRFTPTGGRIAVSAERRESLVVIEVQDTGIGIAPDHLSQVFGRFYQVDSSTTRRHGGLGLGLAIVRHLVEAHGGSVNATSAGVGLGATFTIQLPISPINVRVDSEMVAGSRAHPCSSPAGLPIHLLNVRALVVDDDPASLELAQVVLERAGATVTPAESAREALAIQDSFDIVISDIGMPEVDGYEFMRRFRSRESGPNTPAIALTAYARAEDEQSAIQAGYQEHLTKPVDPSVLIDAVERWTRSRSSGK